MRARTSITRLQGGTGWVLFVVFGFAACSNEPTSNQPTSNQPTSNQPTDDASQAPGTNASTSEASDAEAPTQPAVSLNDAATTAPAPVSTTAPHVEPLATFRYGINAGYPNPDFDDQDLLTLELRAGSTSQRVSLPETHLERWGYEIEVADVTAYRERGMGALVAFLTSPTREHSSAPDSAEDWELAFYAPKNLYEPVTIDGAINPDNYWANYVYRTVSLYKAWIKIWEIWNEPDWVSDWQVTQDWNETAPSANELPHFNGSIYEYVRLLRVSREAARLADPGAKIATGGLGYPSFLDAVFRYTDDPDTGSVSDAHPMTGTAYVDVVSFHHYPIYSAGNSEVGVDSFLKQRADMARVAQARGAQVEWECTETGAPHLATADAPGGDAYARNYLLKAMSLAPSVGIGGVHWFTLSDGAAVGDGGDPYDYMGLYETVATLANPSDAVLTQTGNAYATLTEHLRGLVYNQQATDGLELPTRARGAAFGSDTTRTLVLWATPSDETEDASANLNVDTPSGFTVYAFDASATGDSGRVQADLGQATLLLEGSPQIFVEE